MWLLITSRPGRLPASAGRSAANDWETDTITVLETNLDDINAEILGHRVGLRPVRPEVRLESEPLGGSVLWHNYGHGGAGISLSWGCAAEIAASVLGHLSSLATSARGAITR